MKVKENTSGSGKKHGAFKWSQKQIEKRMSRKYGRILRESTIRKEGGQPTWLCTKEKNFRMLSPLKGGGGVRGYQKMGNSV